MELFNRIFAALTAVLVALCVAYTAASFLGVNVDHDRTLVAQSECEPGAVATYQLQGMKPSC